MISSVAAMVTGQLHEHNINKNKLFDPQKQYDQWVQNLVLVIYSFGTYGTVSVSEGTDFGKKKLNQRVYRFMV